jgi:hypothetical protein
VDIALRARHDLLRDEFLCEATQLRLVRASAGSRFTRDIAAFCNEPRARRFGSQLPNFVHCCSGCSFFSRRSRDEEVPLLAGPLEIEDLPA